MFVYHVAMSSSENKSTSKKERYRMIRDSETNDERDERNKKRRKKYMEQVLKTVLGFLRTYINKVA